MKPQFDSQQQVYMQVRGDGKPACRTMGLAGFLPGSQQVLLQTHAK